VEIMNIMSTLYLIRSLNNCGNVIMVFAPLLSRTREAFRGSDLHVQLALDHGQLPCDLKRIEL
jgi:hypothetical protein